MTNSVKNHSTVLLGTLQIEVAPSPHDLAFIEEQINQYNIALTGFDDYQPLAIFLRRDDRTILAGITGFTWGGSCRISVLWVGATVRGQGIGTALLQAAEAEAIQRGCKVIVLESHAFQAPDFYQKHGYTVAGFRPDYPVGYGDYFLYKHLPCQGEGPS